MRKALTVTGLAAVGLLIACQQQPLTPEPGEIMLESLQFTQSTARVGETLVLSARAEQGETASPQPVHLTTSSGERTAVLLNGQGSDCPKNLTAEDFNSPVRISAWDSCSDVELTALIHDAQERAFIGFKEANADRGVDEKGRVLVSDETIEQMKAYVQTLGVTIRSNHDDAPYISATVPAKLSLISHIRNHPNIDYLEPIIPGERLAADSPVQSNLVLTAISPEIVAEAGISVESGTALTAEYRQPDGSILTTTVTLRN